MSITLPPFMAPPNGSPSLPAAARGGVFAHAVDLSPALVAIFDPDSLATTYINSTGLRWLDPERRSDSPQFLLPDIMGVGSLDRLKNELLPMAHAHGRWRGQCTLRDVWGSEIPVEAALTFHDKTEPAGYCLQAVRVTGSSAGDSATSDHELLHALLETVPDTVYFKDRHSRFLRVSRSLARRDGRDDPVSFIGRTDFDRFTMEHALPAYEDEQRIVRTGEPLVDVEEKETWPDGRVTWVSSTKLPLRDSNGQIVGTFGISRDITARKQAEAERRDLEIKLQLAQKLESIGRLAAGVAHEINTPTQFISDNTHFLAQSFPRLAALIGSYRELARTAAAHEPCSALARAAAAREAEIELDYLLAEIPKCVAQTLDGLGRIARIVGSLKEFSHPNNANRAPADLNHLLETAITVSRHEWKYVADLVTDFDPTLPPVPCIVDEFNQVILNLMINAAHAIESALKKAGTPHGRGRITLRTRRDGDWAVVEVEDTGSGIPEEIRSRVFEPFFTTKEVGKGTGQGLAIVHTVIVKHHGGAVDFTSEVGRGTAFSLRLPLAPPAANPTAP